MLKQNKRLVIYLVCVGIASIFWLLNALSKEYTVELTFPVRYTNLPKNKILVNEPPSEFKIQVNSYGFTLLRHKLSLSFKPLVFNVNEYTRRMMETTQKTKYSISTRQNIDHISDQLSSELKVNSISPDSLHFLFDRIVEKKVKIYPDVQIDLKKQFQLSGNIRTKPDSVMVYGPQSVLDSLQYFPTRFHHFKSVSEAIQRNVSLVEIDNLRTDVKRIVLNVPIEEFTESQMHIPITVENKPENTNLKLFPNRAKVSFLVGLSRYSEIIPEDFRLSVSWNEISEGKTRLKIDIRELPPFIKSVTIDPEEVEYLIEK